jgi:Ca2+-binding RTX toxin-like protein
VYTISGFSVAVSTFNAWAAAGDNAAAQSTIFASNDVITGGPLADQLRAYAGNDLIQAGGGADTLDGGAGNDTLDGGAGGDVIITGGGADVIVIGQGQSLAGQTDVVSDWNSGDTIQFAHVAGDASTYSEGTAADMASATTMANGLIASGAANVVAVQVGSDVAVFADSADNNGTQDDVVVLTGRTLADVSASNFGLTAVVVPPPSGGPGYILGTSANDTLTGTSGADTIDGGAGGDTIITNGGADVIVIGQGQSLAVWNQTDTVTDWNSSDTVRFAHMSGDATAYVEGTAADWRTALDFANSQIGSGVVNVVAVQIGSDVGVFADSADNNVVGDLVSLSGRTLADVSSVNFGLGAASQPPPVITPPPAAPTGLALASASDSGAKGDGITNIAKVTITGVADHGASVSVYDGATLVGTGTADATTGAFSFSTTSALADGAHALTARASTSAGQSVASAPVQVTIDTHAGVSAIGDFTEVAAGKKFTVGLTGTASDQGGSGVSSVGVFQDGVSVGSVQPVGGAWSFSKTQVSDAVHTYTTQTTDVAGNVSAGSTTLILGSTGGDKIVGGATNDIIHGDSGADTLTGGAGSDVFVYDNLNDALAPRSKGGAVDTITDFQNGTDKLDLSDLGHMTFKGQSATLAAHEVSWYVSGGNTYVIGDVSGDGKSDFIIQLTGTHSMTGSDFLLS